MKNKRTTITLVLIAATAAFAATKPFFKPKDGFVPDPRTAIAAE